MGLLSAVIIGVLLAVAVFLISNTISVAAAFRRQENEMRLIGATNYMIRAPFVVEACCWGCSEAYDSPGRNVFFVPEGRALYQ